MKQNYLQEKEVYCFLQVEKVSDESYRRSKKVWTKFKIKKIGDYDDLHVKTDVILLVHVFELLRNMCL